jgi:hypothetical protein
MKNLIQISVFNYSSGKDKLLYSFLMQRNPSLDAQGLLDEEDIYEMMEEVVGQHGKNHFTVAQRFELLKDNCTINFEESQSVLDFDDLMDSV